MAITKEMPLKASQAEAVAETGPGADTMPPNAIPFSERATEHGEHVSPTSSTNGAEAKDEKAAATPEEQRSKGKIALIMSALCVGLLLT